MISHKRVILLVPAVVFLAGAVILTIYRRVEPTEDTQPVRLPPPTLSTSREAVEESARVKPETVRSDEQEIHPPVSDPARTDLQIAGHVEESTSAPPPPRAQTGIEGYVSSKGRYIGGAIVSWRETFGWHVPESWESPSLDSWMRDGEEVDLFTPNPLNPERSDQLCLGRGYRRYDVGIGRAIRTTRGQHYEVTVDSRYIHAWVFDEVLAEGGNLDSQIGEFGIDLTGQTEGHDAETVRYHSVCAGPNNLWRRFRTEFTASGETTAVWLHAAQLSAHLGLVWFDNLTVRPLGGEEVMSLLEKPAEHETEHGGFSGSVMTGPKGYYRIPGLQPGHYELLATYSGEGSSRASCVRVTKGEMTTADLVLRGGGVIQGVVAENITGDAISGAGVVATLSAVDAARITAEGIARKHETDSDDEGRFHFRGLLPGMTYYVTADAEGYISPRPVAAFPDGRRVTLGMSPKGGILGTVRERGTGTPVEGAFIRVYTEERRVAAAETDEDGSFQLRGLGPGTYGITAERHGCVGIVRSSSGVEVVLESRSDMKEVHLEVPSGAGVRGKVTDFETKQPVPNLPVVFRLAWEYESNVTVHLPEYGGETSWDPSMMTRRVNKGPEVETALSRAVVRTDESGGYSLEGMGRGIWEVTLVSDEYVLIREYAAVVEPGGETVLDMKAVRNPVVEGMVVDEDGQPVDGARIWPRRYRNPSRRGWERVCLFELWALAHSEPDGRFSLIVWDPDAEYDLVATTEDGRMGLLEGAAVGEPGLEIVVKRFGRIEGRIRYESGRPLVGTKVHAIGGELYGGHWWRDDFTDSGGRFGIDQLPDWVYFLEFGTREPEIIARYGPVRVENGETVSDIDLVIPGRGGLTGSVRLESGGGVPGIRVTAARLDPTGMPAEPVHWMRVEPNPPGMGGEPELELGTLVREIFTDPEGNYVITDLLEGLYQVAVESPGDLRPFNKEVAAQTEVQVGDALIGGIDFVLKEDVRDPYGVKRTRGD